MLTIRWCDILRLLNSKNKKPLCYIIKLTFFKLKKGLWQWWSYIFWFLLKWDPFKKITNLGKSCQFGTTSYEQIDNFFLNFIVYILGSKLCNVKN